MANMNRVHVRRMIALLVSTMLVPPSQGQDKKVLIIGIDGLSPDAMMKADTPHLGALMEEGGYSREARTGRFTVSGPGWSRMLTGVWAPKHNVPDNEFLEPAYDRFPHFFVRLKKSAPTS